MGSSLNASSIAFHHVSDGGETVRSPPPLSVRPLTLNTSRPVMGSGASSNPISWVIWSSDKEESRDVRSREESRDVKASKAEITITRRVLSGETSA